MRIVLAVFRVAMMLAAARLARALREGEGTPSESFLILWWAMLITASLCLVLTAAGAFWFAVPFCVLAVLLMPWTTTRRVLIPLGMSRAAQVLGALSGWTWYRDRRCGGLVAASWALLRQEAPSAERIGEIVTALGEENEQAKGTVSGTRVLATGLITAAQGDLRQARLLLASVDELGKHTTPPAVHALAREWLVVTAAEEGRWDEVAELAGGRALQAGQAGHTRQTGRTRLTQLLGAIGARLSQSPKAPKDAQLWALWLVSPMRASTLALVKAALAVAPRSSQDTKNKVPRLLTTSLAPDPYGDALRAHVMALARPSGALSADELRSLARAWDQALNDPSTRSLVLARAAALGGRQGAQAGERVLARLTETVAADLAAMARAAGLPLSAWSSGSNILSEAQRSLRDELLAEVELAFDALAARVSQKRSLPPLDEWREWLSLRELCRRAGSLGGLELRRLAFPHVHHTVCKWAVWLWNDRRELLMANAMFRWLLDEALEVGDSEAIELQSRNWDKAL